LIEDDARKPRNAQGKRKPRATLRKGSEFIELSPSAGWRVV
jgi:hypothetical protein